MALKKIPKKTLPATPRLASVPDKEILDKYIGRKFDNKTEFEIFEFAFRNEMNVLIEGPTGPGKTMAMRAFAAYMGKPFYSIPSNVGVEPSQLFGKLIPSTDPDVGGLVWQNGPVTDLVVNGGVLLLNEVNFLPPRVATVVFGLLDERREIVLLDNKGEVCRAHRFPVCWCDDGVDCKRQLFIAADMNPNYAGTIELNDAFRNRFAIQLDWDYDPEVETHLVRSTSLRDIAGMLRKQQKNGTISTPVSTNMLMEFERIVGELGIDFAATNFIGHFVEEDRAAARNALSVVRANLEADYRPKPPPPPPKQGDDVWEAVAQWVGDPADEDEGPEDIDEDEPFYGDF